MSRQRRPLRRVRGAERDRVAHAVAAAVSMWVGALLNGGAATPEDRWPYPVVSRRLRCRPAQLRRCVLGLPVSTRAAGRILAAASRQLRSGDL